MDLMPVTRLKGLPGPILVTGHTGFKGTWLTFLLECLQVPVIGFSLPPDTDSLFDRAKRSGSIPEVFSDIRNLEAVSRFITKYKPSAIIHMAAQSLVLESYKTPRDTFETNVMGTVNVLDSAFKTKSVEAVVVVTTDKVYQNNNSSRAFVETDPLVGKDPYSASKVGTESVVAAWQQIANVSGGPKLISVRAGNVIGGGDWAENRLVPDLVRGLISGNPIHIRNPGSTRPWQHILDPLRGYLLALNAILGEAEFSSLNFGPAGTSLTVKKVAEIAVENWPNKVKIIFHNESLKDATEAINLHLDSSAARRSLNWDTHWNQEQAVRDTFQWWHQLINEGANISEICSERIAFMLNPKMR